MLLFTMKRTVRRKLKLDKAYEYRALIDKYGSQTAVAKILGVSRQRVNQIVNHIQHDARVKLNRAVKDGRVNKPDSCECCGVVDGLHGHHRDYGLPLKVDWLCSNCHGLHHKKYTL